MKTVRDSKDLVVGLDIGTSKVAIVAELARRRARDPRHGRARVAGPEEGRGRQLEATVAAIQRALEEAELMADCKIRGSTPASRAATSAASTRRHGRDQGQEVAQPDVDRVIETARAVNIPTDQQILHVLARNTSSTARRTCASRSG